MDRREWLTGALALVAGAALAEPAPIISPPTYVGPADATLLIVRHAEKPDRDGGPRLTKIGEARAGAYVRYFGGGGAGYLKTFWLDEDSKPIDALVATADTAKSARPRLTLEPLSRALHLPIQQPFKNEEVQGLADWLTDRGRGRTTLIAWHHGRIPKLLAALGADPDSLVPGGVWPDDMYEWVIELRYDAHGRLTLARRVVEGLTGELR